MDSFEDAFHKQIISELGCRPCGEVAAIRALKVLAADHRRLESECKQLIARLARHECVDHDPPKFGECETCDEHNPDESWKDVER